MTVLTMPALVARAARHAEPRVVSAFLQITAVAC
jgi:hypothetical protein